VAFGGCALDVPKLRRLPGSAGAATVLACHEEDRNPAAGTPPERVPVASMATVEWEREFIFEKLSQIDSQSREK
jgi:hypothetical protein